MTTTALTELGIDVPVLAAPMAGGPTTPALVLAAQRSGGLGFLAGGYRTAQALGEQLDAVGAATGRFGVNLFAPNPVPVEHDAYRRYREGLAALADRYEVNLPPDPIEDDDRWQDKIDLLLARPVPVVSFTFGIPERAALAALRRVGSLLVQTVTSATEATRAADSGADALVVQASAAGGHSATLTPQHIPADRPLTGLLAEVRRSVNLPLVATGGLATASQVVDAIHAGADAVMVGTALLRSPESGASPTHRAALADGSRTSVVTRAFTGRPARALRNIFIDNYDAVAPSGYPALHHLTSALRRAAGAAGDLEYLHLWAGTGYRQAGEQPAEQILGTLATEL